MNEYEDQVIMVYTYNIEDEDDIIFVHDEIKDRKICEGAISSNIEYKTNLDTLANSEARQYNSDKIKKIKAERPNPILNFLMDVVTSEAFTAAALIILTLAISALIIGAAVMGAPVVAGAVAVTGAALGFGTMCMLGFFCRRDDAKSLDEVPEVRSHL